MKDEKNLKRAQQLQLSIDDSYSFDIQSFQRSELEAFKSRVEEFLLLGIETEDLMPAGDYTMEDVDTIHDPSLGAAGLDEEE